MKRQCYNPYLPSWEYIPDAEPRVFGQRLYIYGSHDLFGAKEYCEGDYVCWSTPVEDLSDWRYEGVIFKKQDTPWNKENLSYYAPDVVRGTDGRLCAARPFPRGGTGRHRLYTVDPAAGL